jgi:hypothetical protein
MEVGEFIGKGNQTLNGHIKVFRAQSIEVGGVKFFRALANKRVVNLWQNHIFSCLHELLTNFQTLNT